MTATSYYLAAKNRIHELESENEKLEKQLEISQDNLKTIMAKRREFSMDTPEFLSCDKHRQEMITMVTKCVVCECLLEPLNLQPHCEYCVPSYEDEE